MKKYVVGFCFSDDGGSVLLIQKNRPDWQKGLLNGIGGKVEQDEDSTDAMVREFYEETGVQTEFGFGGDGWDCFAVMGNNEFNIWMFRLFSSKGLLAAKTATDEEVKIFPTGAAVFRSPHVRNLEFLIPLALHKDIRFTNISYEDPK